MDGQAGQGAVGNLRSLLGPADTYKLETYGPEERRDPSEFLVMCSLFRQYIYIPPGPKPTFRFVHHWIRVGAQLSLLKSFSNDKMMCLYHNVEPV